MKTIFNKPVKATPKHEDLVVLQDYGYDTGRFEHINVSVGLVDVRTLSSVIDNSDKEGYQRELTQQRINKILDVGFHISKLDPITISLRDNKRLLIDGQARSQVWKILFLKGAIATPMIPCKILQNATEKDERILFGTQDEGKSAMTPKAVTKSLTGADKAITALDDMVKKHGMNLRSGKGSISGHVALKTQFLQSFSSKNRDFELAIIERAIKVLSQSYEEGKIRNSTSTPMIKAMLCLYKNYFMTIDDEWLINKLRKTTPDAIIEEFKAYKSKLDKNRMYLKPLTKLYNNHRKSGHLNYD